MQSTTQNDESMESRLKAATSHLNSLITSIDDIVFEIDGNLVFKNVWVQDESMLFMPKEHFIGKRINEVMGPQSNIFTEPIHDVIKAGGPREVIYKHIDPSVHKWYKLKIRQVIKASELSELTMVLTIQDVTYQVLSDMLLEETKKKLETNRQLLEVSQHLGQTAGWELNLQTNDVFWTKQAYMLFELTENFLPTFENTQEFVYKDDQEKIDKCIREAVGDNKPFDVELRVITARGRIIWVRCIGIPVIGNKEVVAIRGAFMDISKHKENENELIKARTDAEKASKAKSDFLSIMSHEIRTPLNGIIGIANLLKLNYSEDQKDYINNLIFSADHLMQLINDILDLTKMENDKLELTFSDVDLRQLVKNIKNQFQSLAEAKNIDLTYKVDEDIPLYIFADSVRLGQILINLISNAIKFTTEGSVSIDIKQVSKKNDEVILKFSVTDTGEGISKESQKTVFESFKQVRNVSNQKQVGTGLGLAITKRLVELHDSRINLKSEAGKGSEFYFEAVFKTASTTVKKAGPGFSPEAPDDKEKLSKLRLLLVEDNFINVIVAKKQLEHFGIQPDSAGSGIEALKILKEKSYDIALVDLHMPGMDGYELSKIIKQEYPDIHIVIFTADIMAEVKIKLAELDIHDILNKPFSPQRMYEILYDIATKKGIITDL